MTRSESTRGIFHFFYLQMEVNLQDFWHKKILSSANVIIFEALTNLK